MRAYLRTTVLSFQVFSPIRPPFQTNARQRDSPESSPRSQAVTP
jgi:hypothetical protein